MSAELRVCVNKIIEAYNRGNNGYTRKHGPKLLQTYSDELKIYEEVADVLDELLFIFDACGLPDETRVVTDLIGALPKPFVLPSGDTHFELFVRNGKYQEMQRQVAFNHITNWRLALDIGGHVGFWANGLAERFETVHSFEPNPVTFECLLENKSGNVIAHRFGLGDGFENRYLSYPNGNGTTEPANSGGWEITNTGDEGTYPVEVKPLDSLHLEPDFIKIDVQGHELQVLLGARETIVKYRPVILIELVADGIIHQEALEFIENQLGMVRKEFVNKDFVYGW